MVTKKENWFRPIYKRIKSAGVKTDAIAARLGISRTALRLWFDNGILDWPRADKLANALEDFSRDVSEIAREIREGYRSN